MTSLPPLPEPPADDVAQVLDELRQARHELRDAERIAHMLMLHFPGEAPDRIGRYRLDAEQFVAGCRVSSWRLLVETLEGQARGLGLDVSSHL